MPVMDAGSSSGLGSIFTTCSDSPPAICPRCSLHQAREPKTGSVSRGPTTHWLTVYSGLGSSLALVGHEALVEGRQLEVAASSYQGCLTWCTVEVHLSLTRLLSLCVLPCPLGIDGCLSGCCYSSLHPFGCWLWLPWFS